MIKVLEQHNIEYIQQGQDIYVIDLYTINGTLHAEWLLMTPEDVMVWLGY